MKFKTMLNRLLAVFVAILIALPATSLTAAPTDEQIRQFKNLSPQQQAAVKASYLGGGAATGSTTQPLDTPENVLPMMNDSTSQIEEAAIESTDETTLEEKKEEKKIEEKLEQFGYDLFAGEATTFAPVSDIPVPSEYVIGPGDTLQIFLFGKESVEHQLQVSREGELNFPGIGPIQVAGMRFDELKTSLNQRISQQMIGVRASITLGRLRSIRVFILGDVRRPGSYTVSALSTMTNALFVSGGVTKIGSLRNVQLKRRGNVVTTLDLYDLLLKGDTSQDARIQPGDVLFVPPIGEVAGIGGEVRRPALYELKQERTVADLVQMAGGILPTADLKSAQIERINPMGERILLDLDLAAAQSQGIELISGDAIRVYSILDKMEAIVQLAGHVQRSGGSQWFEGMRLSALLRSTRDVLQEADLGYVLIEREGLHGGKLDVLTASLTEAWEKPGAEGDPLLLPRDYVTVLSLEKSRAQPISKVVQKLKQEERFGQRANVVSVAGNVRFAGDYPYQQEMTVADLVKAALNVLPI
ncbi:MAG: ATPase, partial [Gammaproteobacteria bacterium]|nr:ATPase [Gammaproteobacteria bacterium]